MDKELNDFKAGLISLAKVKFPERNIVMGEGSIHSKIMLIGEAPGGDEEKLGRPFVGKAGKNLTYFLESVGIDRKSLYITNVVKVRPYKLSKKTGRKSNRPPNREELEFFIPFLDREIEAVKPELIVTLGNTPLRAVTKDKTANIGDYHGQLIYAGEYRLFPLYHPAAIIYNNKLEEVYNEDIWKLKRFF